MIRRGKTFVHVLVAWIGSDHKYTIKPLEKNINYFILLYATTPYKTPPKPIHTQEMQNQKTLFLLPLALPAPFTPLPLHSPQRSFFYPFPSPAPTLSPPLKAPIPSPTQPPTAPLQSISTSHSNPSHHLG